jgi:cysteinyl-tRNA synthetase
VPIDPGRVRLCCCGPTVYNTAHIGNLRTYVFEDLLVRMLREAGYKVIHVMNITDVGHLQSDRDEGEDKMILASEREHRSPWDIARSYEGKFFADCAALNVRRPDIVCRATEHVPAMIAFVEKLQEHGCAYEIDGNVYFDVSTRPDYEALRGSAANESAVVSRVEADTRKRHPKDFVLWFSQSKFPRQIMKWDSPWGVGFPGWHIECSAMASKYLGSRIDIHCGGIDHIPIHHTNEIAQSECYHGHRWVNWWMHAEFLVLDRGKMSKSSGEFLDLSAVQREGFEPLHYRYLCLGAHYRSHLRFSWEALDVARRSLQNLCNRIISLRLSLPANKGRPEAPGPASEHYRNQFRATLADDLNVPVALSVLWSAVKDTELVPSARLALVEEFDHVFGLNLINAQPQALPEDAMAMIRERERARAKSDWARADELRSKLVERGVMVKDTAKGSEWYLAETE